MLLAPPKSPNGKYFIVPTGIRPVLQKTRIEVCNVMQVTQYILHTCIGTFSSSYTCIRGINT